MDRIEFPSFVIHVFSFPSNLCQTQVLLSRASCICLRCSFHEFWHKLWTCPKRSPHSLDGFFYVVFFLLFPCLSLRFVLTLKIIITIDNMEDLSREPIHLFCFVDTLSFQSSLIPTHLADDVWVRVHYDLAFCDVCFECCQLEVCVCRRGV